MRSTVLFALAISCPGAFRPAVAQKCEKPPKRPKVSATADTNDARMYFDLGVSMFEEEPNVAADAFYWAMRINPIYADAFSGRRTALIMQQRNLRTSYINGGRKAYESKELARIDSLYLHALQLNPFLFRRLDRRLWRLWWIRP